jgi:hypothetical protein
LRDIMHRVYKAGIVHQRVNKDPVENVENGVAA